MGAGHYWVHCAKDTYRQAKHNFFTIPSMKLNAKVTLFFVAMSVGLMVVLVSLCLYAFRSFSISAVRDHLRTAAEIVRVHLTESMINGVINKREQFLSRLMEVQGIKSAHVVRSDEVTRQFGKGLNTETVADEVELGVLRDGKARFDVVELKDDTILRATIPYIASTSGTPNCLQCHQVRPGAVLGAVTMTMSVESLRNKAMLTVLGIALVIALFTLVVLFLLGRLLRPVSATAHAVEVAVHDALEGNFKSRIDIQTHDEIGQIARDMNRLLGFLNKGLNTIGTNVARLTERTPSPGENLLTATIDTVDSLTKAARFKQAIEEDEATQEIYQRLARTIESEFGIREYSLYKVGRSKAEITPIIVDGELDGACRWCDAQIQVRPEACRARRTGHIVDSVDSPGICYAFSPPTEAENRRHICFPIMQSGSVGSVMQLVVTPEAGQQLHDKIPYIGVYLRESAPVLETKRLMETLREANLRDPMTGLNNRRFLEEYVDTLLANVQRNSIHLAILMLDLDYFKMVNDTHGHDAGDAVLKALARVLKQKVRASDMVIRYGGEEFLIILQNTQAEAADKVAENIRLGVEAMKTQVGGVILQKTISIGIADFPADSETFWQAVKFADVALYQAKHSGRNRVVRFTAEMWEDKKEY